MNGRELDGKIALVTGGGTGIGRAVAVAYADRGARVWICGRRVEPLAATVSEIRAGGGQADHETADVGSVGDIERLRRRIEAAAGRLDVLVNNAGILGPTGPLVEIDPAGWDQVMRVNLTGLFLAVRAFVPLLARSGGASVINVTSGLGRRAHAGWGPYCVSKFGLEGLTQVLAEEMTPHGIRVNAVNPGATRTAMRAAAFPGEDPMRLPPPEEAAGIFVWLASDDSRGVTGRSLDAPSWRRGG